MDWIRIPTDSLLYSELPDKDLLTLIKYQALYCQLETEPNDAQLLRVFSKKQIEFLQKNSEIVKSFVEKQIKKVREKRKADKDRYLTQQEVRENSACGKRVESVLSGEADKVREDKVREEYPPTPQGGEVLIQSKRSFKNGREPKPTWASEGEKYRRKLYEEMEAGREGESLSVA